MEELLDCASVCAPCEPKHLPHGCPVVAGPWPCTSQTRWEKRTAALVVNFRCIQPTDQTWANIGKGRQHEATVCPFCSRYRPEPSSYKTCQVCFARSPFSPLFGAPFAPFCSRSRKRGDMPRAWEINRRLIVVSWLGQQHTPKMALTSLVGCLRHCVFVPTHLLRCSRLPREKPLLQSCCFMDFTSRYMVLYYIDVPLMSCIIAIKL